MKSPRKQLLPFFMIAFAWMWLLNLPRLLDSFGVIELNPLVSTILGYTAVFGPGIAAFVLTGIHEKKAGMKALWKRGWDTHDAKKWILPALLLMPVSGGISLLILSWLDQPIPWEYGLSPAMIVPIGLIIWLVGAYPEEYGWRGYALPRLLEKYSPLSASLILGLIWGVWHLPLHFIEGTSQSAIPVWEYLVQTLALSVVYTWLHLRAGGSVFAASLFHAMGNITGAVFPYWVTAAGRWVSFFILLVPVVILAVQMNHKGKEPIDLTQ